MPLQALEKLRQFIETEVPTVHMQMMHKDHFALGCYLHAQGHKRAGLKLCGEVLGALGYKNRGTYFRAIVDSLDGNEVTYAREVWAHAEINELMRQSA